MRHGRRTKRQLLPLLILKAVKDSNSTTPADVDALRALGYNDEDIYEGLALGAWMVAGDIVSNALHVERDF